VGCKLVAKSCSYRALLITSEDTLAVGCII